MITTLQFALSVQQAVQSARLRLCASTARQDIICLSIIDAIRRAPTGIMATHQLLDVPAALMTA